MTADRRQPSKLTSVQSNVMFLCRQLRERAGLSQREMARQTGRHYQSIQRWERGSWLDDADTLIADYAQLGSRDSGWIWRAAIRSWDAPLAGSPKFPSQPPGRPSARRRAP